MTTSGYHNDRLLWCTVIYCGVRYTVVYCNILWCTDVHLFFQVHGAHDSESGTAVGPAGPDGDEDAT